MYLGELGIVLVSISPYEVFLHALADVSMIPWVAVFDDEVVGGRQMAFETVHPGGVGSGEDEGDSMLPTPLPNLLGRVRRQIVQNEVDALGLAVAVPDGLEESEHLRGVLPSLVMHPQDVLVDVVGAEEIADPSVPGVGGPVPHRVLLRRPGGAGMGLDLHGPHFVEADYDRVLRRTPVEAVDAFFFEEKSGSFDSFQVRVRW